ncbi:glycine cleavage system aminomethyltransferase GcvT [Candidatus Fermentibacteria bacterium]|nr:glycine cleavage system aminomethyltransferase GcvT [Candidatus Fermentibacteria bacterium]
MEKKTSLYEKHVELGARMTPFAGFIMPVRYDTLISEHMAVRENVGMFDLSHMGEFRVKGPAATEFLDNVLTNDAEVDVGSAFYSTMCYPDGGIVDDLVVYRLDDTEYLIVVNASNIEKDWAWVSSHAKAFDVETTNESDSTTLVAVQGPNASQVVSQLTDVNLKELGFYHQRMAEVANKDALLARTGYTGEDGFEIYVSSDDGPALWDAVSEAGSSLDTGPIVPVGLGARDTLRLEMGYALYGNDIDHTTTPIEARLSWVVKLKTEKEFIGREVLARQKREKPGRYLVGLELQDKGIAREGVDLFEHDRKVGEVTSGTLGPAVGHCVCLGYVERGYHKIGRDLEVEIRGKRKNINRVKLPFYKDGTHL